MRVASGLVLFSVLLSIACGSVIARQYEYEEEIFLALDGSASVYVNAAVPALVALRGAPLPVDPAARLDREVVRDFYESPVSHVASVTTSRRNGRRYVHLRIDVADIRRLSEAAPFTWSSYRFEPRDAQFEYTQVVTASPGPDLSSIRQDVGDVGWTGAERVAFRLHLPSRVTFHNAPSRTIDRGNIIVWEQSLADRVKGGPVEIQVRMETASILYRTLALFIAMMVVVALTFAAAIWFVKSRKTTQTGD